MDENTQTAIEPYRIRDLVDGGTIEITTIGNVAIPVSLDLLSRLVSKKPNDRPPDKAELAMFANTIIEQKCNPYLKECWLVMMRGQYQPVIAAQKRVAKAQSLATYDGYEWGWIGKDGTRCPNGPESTIKEVDIAGVWGRIYFKDRKVPYYHEVLRSEYPHSKNDRPITMLLKTARDQIHKYAFANEMGNLCTENEPQEFETLPPPECDTPPRDERRKKIDSTPVEVSPLRKPVEPVTDEGTEATGSAGEEVAVGATLDLEADYDEKGGEDFTAWAADVLCVGDDEINDAGFFNADRIETLKQHLAVKGV